MLGCLVSEILSSEQVTELLKEAATTKKIRKPKYNYDDRSVSGFFKLPIERSLCKVPTCSDPDKERMVVAVNTVSCCRICFLAGFGLEG